MKYMCRSCKKKCDDILEHVMTVHKFSKETIESQLQTNPDTFKNSFEKLKITNSKNFQIKNSADLKGRY